MLILLKRLRPRVLQTKSIALSLFLLSILLQAIYTFIPIATGSVISALENKASREEYSGVLLIFAIVQISMVICDRVYRRIYIYRRDVFENTQVNEGRRQLFSLDNSLIADKGTGRLIAMKNKGIT
jgi:ABC-type multidrug transport system fused ATPase/permease subunit